MTLKLNTSREAYKEFYGRNTEQMPKLIAEGRVPMNVAQLMQRRLDVRNSDTKVKSSYMDNYFDTGDGVVYHPDGRVKIVLDSEDLRDMTPDILRNGGALILGEDVYKTLEGIEIIDINNVGKLGESLSKEQAKSHSVWIHLARGDKTLLKDYTDYIFSEYKERFAENKALDDLKLMGIFPGSANGETPEMRAWYVCGLEYRSNASGRLDLGNGSGRLLGIAPEALSASGKGASNHLESKVLTALNSEKSFEYNGTIYVPVVKDSGLKL